MRSTAPVPSAPLRWAVGVAACVVILLGATSRAEAYPFMIRHGYTGCTPCHTDPSGGAGVLTEYGREQSDRLLRMHYGEPKAGEADRTAGFLWGLVPLPEQLRLGGDFREAYFVDKAQGAPLLKEFIMMRADLTADIKIGRLRAAGSIGYVPQGDLPAALTNSPTDNVISREHWVGAELDDDGFWLLRAGRMAVPYGIRMIEHTLWVRALTRTDLDATQQYGLSLFFGHDQLRGEVMGIAGNFEVRPDEFRERGYSAYMEYTPVEKLAVGVSSLFTRATRDILLGVTDYRYANGPFLRYAPVTPLVFFVEADSYYQSLTWNGHRSGFAAFVQADYEPIQGLHVMATGESMNGGNPDEPNSYDGWLSVVWFFLPHADLRLDGIYSWLGVPASSTSPSSHVGDTAGLVQIHAFL
jgi:hypothetical protein